MGNWFLTPLPLKIQLMGLEDDGTKSAVCKIGSIGLVGNTAQQVLPWCCSLPWRKEPRPCSLVSWETRLVGQCSAGSSKELCSSRACLSVLDIPWSKWNYHSQKWLERAISQSNSIRVTGGGRWFPESSSYVLIIPNLIALENYRKSQRYMMWSINALLEFNIIPVTYQLTKTLRVRWHAEIKQVDSLWAGCAWRALLFSVKQNIVLARSLAHVIFVESFCYWQNNHVREKEKGDG